MLDFEVRNLHRGLDIELHVVGDVTKTDVEEVLRRVTRLLERQPSQLCVHLEQATTGADAAVPLAAGLIDARAALAEVGGVLMVAPACGPVQDLLPGDVFGP